MKHLYLILASLCLFISSCSSYDEPETAVAIYFLEEFNGKYHESEEFQSWINNHELILGGARFWTNDDILHYYEGSELYLTEDSFGHLNWTWRSKPDLKSNHPVSRLEPYYPGDSSGHYCWGGLVLLEMRIKSATKEEVDAIINEFESFTIESEGYYDRYTAGYDKNFLRAAVEKFLRDE